MANQAGMKTLAQIRSEIANEVVGETDFTTTTRPTLALANILINNAYRDVCASAPWSWLLLEKTFATVAGQTTAYEVDPSAKSVLFMEIRANQTKLNFMPYEQWVIQFPGGYTNFGNTLPTLYTPAPRSVTNLSALAFYLFGPADAVYTVTYGMEVGAPTELTDSLYPIIPVPYQELLKYKSLVKIYEFLGEGSRQRLMDRSGAYDNAWAKAWLDDQRVKESSSYFRNLEDEISGVSTENWNLFGRF